jgi:nucleoside phosphorylase
MDAQDLMFRQFVARYLITKESQETLSAPAHIMKAVADAPVLPPCAKPITHGTSLLPRQVNWAAGDAAPVPKPLPVAPSRDDPLPKADALVMTWTADEVEALARVMTPKVSPKVHEPTAAGAWYEYHRNFDLLKGDLRTNPPWNVHPAIAGDRLGSYFMTEIAGKSVIVFKSELHLNQDGSAAMKEGRELPLVRMTKQIIAEVSPKYFISTGTAGGTQLDHSLGDVVVAVKGIFDCNDPRDFRAAPFNCKQFGNDWWIDDKLFARAQELMAGVTEPPIGVPHPGYADTPLVSAAATKPAIRTFKTLPIVTTDYFEFGTTTNGLDQKGCAVEMDDAMLAMAIADLPAAQQPKYAFVRNVSDPVLNGKLDPWLQAMWAVYYYEHFGIVTSFNSALTCWAILAAA